mgnify:CR=1 FL=1|tara:strand:- start:18874 stop:19332 length:459 start_codon:yes stop_codon:yes gene_type:complete
MRNIFFVLITFSLFSCDGNYYEEYQSFNDGGWHTDSILDFNYTVSDTIASYDLILSVRHSVDYEYQNLFLFLDSEKKDTVEIMLADKAGKWHGRGVSDIREIKHTIKEKKRFSSKGVYFLKIEQAMRYGEKSKIQSLANIIDIGLIISKNNE